MKSKVLAITALSSVILISGCSISVYDEDGGSTNWDNLERKNRRIISKLVPGMHLGEVTALLGVPDFNELYNEDDDRVQVLFYRTHKTRSDGHTTKDECTPVILKNGEVVGWGETAYSAI